MLYLTLVYVTHIVRIIFINLILLLEWSEQLLPLFYLEEKEYKKECNVSLFSFYKPFKELFILYTGGIVDWLDSIRVYKMIK